MKEWPFGDLPRNHYGAIYADPPWQFNTWGTSATRNPKYETLPTLDIAKLPVKRLAATDCVLFLWVIFPDLPACIQLIKEWGFTYKTCAFSWIKADNRQIDLFEDALNVSMTLGYWTRANSEICLLATRGKPKRRNADVRQAIIEPRREHSRKPDCVSQRIERLVAGPYLELFARTQRRGWDCWGTETKKFSQPFDSALDAALSYDAAIKAIGERVKAGEPLPTGGYFGDLLCKQELS